MLNNATNFKLPLLTGKIVKGVVEDNNDPLHMGRLKVRVDGLHSIKMLTEDLPWVMSLEYFSNSNDDTITIGSTTYDKNELRNSVTHGRWHINYDTGIVTFYDYRKEYDYNFEEDIYMGDLYNFVYFNTMTENIKKKLH